MLPSTRNWSLLCPVFFNKAERANWLIHEDCNNHIGYVLWLSERGGLGSRLFGVRIWIKPPLHLLLCKYMSSFTTDSQSFFPPDQEGGIDYKKEATICSQEKALPNQPEIRQSRQKFQLMLWIAPRRRWKGILKGASRLARSAYFRVSR